MRIIGGALKRRRIIPPPDAATTRPMPDHVREALFNLLRGHAEGEAVLDAFAGTGAVGLEAVSRGARRCVFIERDGKMARIIEQNVRDLGVEDRCDVVKADALGPLALARAPRPVHLIFYDPPYRLVWDQGEWERARAQLGRLIQLLDDEGYAVLRTPWPAIHREMADSDVRRQRRRDDRRAARNRAAWDADEDDDIEEVIWELGDPGGPPGSAPGEDDAAGMAADWERAEALDAGPSKPPPQDVDLSIEGAEGPETHVYGKMAVHLYMKSR